MYHCTDAGKYEEVCTTLQCGFGKLKPKATHFDMLEGRWVCFPCAQEANRRAINSTLKYGFSEGRACISSKEYMIKVLMDE